MTENFTDIVWDYYAHTGRDLPWRAPEPNGTYDPYKILVSEIMLQQTQVNRVIPKYQEFLEVFPSVQLLAAASLAEVLRLWSGLGYNRRARFLWLAAQYIVTEYRGTFPQEQSELTKLPGVGKNTAGAICAYAFNKPVVFIETNIRSVYIHHFFADREEVHDKELIPVITDTLDQENPREWYWALMDYGSHLKTTVGNASKRSRHYTKQSTFAGSRRQIRGQVLKQLIELPQTYKQLSVVITDQRLHSVLADLVAEGLIQKTGGRYQLTSR